MIGEELCDSLNWYVIHTHPKQEDRANYNLSAAGLETFAPKTQGYREQPFTGELLPAVQHLFPRYIFARFKVSDALHKVRFTRGVCEVVCFGQRPTPIEEEAITLMRSQIGKNGFVQIGGELKAGDEVRIKGGVFKSLKGILERQMKGSERVVVLLNALAYQGRFIIERRLLEKVVAEA